MENIKQLQNIITELKTQQFNKSELEELLETSSALDNLIIDVKKEVYADEYDPLVYFF